MIESPRRGDVRATGFSLILLMEIQKSRVEVSETNHNQQGDNTSAQLRQVDLFVLLMQLNGKLTRWLILIHSLQ